MSWNPEKTLDAVRECVRNISEHRGTCHWDLKSDKSLVTDIDKSNEAILRKNLENDGDLFLGEESVSGITPEYFRKIIGGTAYIVDPIDGTAPFAHRLPLWAISVGYSEKGLITDGCIVLPDLNEAYISHGEDVLFSRDVNAPLQDWIKLQPPCEKWSEGAMLITGQDFTKRHLLNFKNPVLVPGSAVQSFSALLSGKAIAYIGHMKLWDVAGSISLLRRMGFCVRLLKNGQEFNGEISDDFFVLDFASDRLWAFNSDLVTTMPDNHKHVNELLARERQI